MGVTTDERAQVQGQEAEEPGLLASTVKTLAVLVGVVTFALGLALPVAWIVTGLCAALLLVGGHAESTASEAVQAKGAPLSVAEAGGGCIGYALIVLALGALAFVALLSVGIDGSIGGAAMR